MPEGVMMVSHLKFQADVFNVFNFIRVAKIFAVQFKG